MSSNRNSPSRSGRGSSQSPQNSQQPGSLSSWFARTFRSSPNRSPEQNSASSDPRTTRRGKAVVEQGLRDQISYPMPLPRARRYPPDSIEKDPFSYPQDLYVAPRQAPAPPKRRPERAGFEGTSRLSTYHDDSIGSHGLPPSPPPNRPLPPIPFNHGPLHIPISFESEVSLPPRSFQASRATMVHSYMNKPDASPSAPSHSESFRSSQHIQGKISPDSISARDSDSSPHSSPRTPVATYNQESQIEDIATPLSGSNSPASQISASSTHYRQVSDSAQEINLMNPEIHQSTSYNDIESSSKGVPQTSPRFVTSTPPISPTKLSSQQASEPCGVLDIFPLSQIHSSWIKPKTNIAKVIPKTRVHTEQSLIGVANDDGTTLSTPSHGGVIDFASETPEQRGARHARNQAVYDRMSPVLERLHSEFEVVRDWVTEHGGVANQDEIQPFLSSYEFKRSPRDEKYREQKLGAVTCTRKSASEADLPDLPELSTSNTFDENQKGVCNDVPETSETKQSVPESVETIVTHVADISDLSMASDVSNASPSVSSSVVRRLRKKTNYHNLRAPRPATPIVRVTDEDFYEEIQTRLLESPEPVVNTFIGIRSLDSFPLNEDNDLETSVNLKPIENDVDDHLPTQIVQPNEESLQASQQHSFEDSRACFVKCGSPFTSSHEETAALNGFPMDFDSIDDISGERVSMQARELGEEDILALYDDFFARPIDQTLPLKSCPKGDARPLVIIPPPTTPDGYLDIKSFLSNGTSLTGSRPENFDPESCYRVPKKQLCKEQRTVPINGSSRRSSSRLRLRGQVHVGPGIGFVPRKRSTAQRECGLRPTVLSTIREEPEEEERTSQSRSSHSSPNGDIARPADKMSGWLLNIAIVDETGRIWIRPVSEEREFELLAKYDDLPPISRPGEARYVRVGTAAMLLTYDDDEMIKKHLLPLRCKKVAAEGVERERKSLLKRWADNDIALLEIPAPVLERLYDEERGKPRSITELTLEETTQIVRDTRKEVEGRTMERVKLEARTAGSSKWLRMSPFAKRRLLKSNVTDLMGRLGGQVDVEGDLAREPAPQGRKQKYRARRKSETFVVFEARRRRENHENAPPVLGTAVGRPKPRKMSFLTRCKKAVQGFFRAAVGLTGQPKPAKTATTTTAPPECGTDAANRGKQRMHRRKRSVVKGFFSPILPSSDAKKETQIVRKD